MSTDAVIVGGGHNGLVAALRLRRSGMRVVVCERREVLGGLAAPEEFHPGYTSPGLLHDASNWRPWLTRELGLELVGMPAAPLSIPLDADRRLVVTRDPRSAELELSGAGGSVEAYGDWRAFVDAVAPALRRLLDRPAPRLDVQSLGDAFGLARDGWSLRRLGRSRMTELMRILPMPAADWLRESFGDEALIEGLAAPGVLGTWLGPHSAGSAANLLFHEATCGAEGLDPGNIVRALTTACDSAGVELLRSSEVEGIVVEQGRVRAVRLARGKTIDCPRIVTTCDPKTALLRLVPPAALALRVRDALTQWRTRGSAAKLHLALDGPLRIGGVECPRARIGGGTVDDLERAFDAIKYRRPSSAPFLDVRQSGVAGSSVPARGGVVLSILAAFAPYGVQGGWTDAARKAFLEAVLVRLERYAPEIRRRMVAAELLVPEDLERRYGCSGGQLHHGEHALDQLLFVRPNHRLAHYRTPLEGLFISGGGTHPGGGISGVPGWLAAGAVLAR